MEKKSILLKIKFLICIFLVIVLILIQFYNNNKLIISNQINKEVYFSTFVKKGDILVFEWEHSFEHILWKEFYEITPDNEFKLFTIAVEGFGAGIPAEMDCTYRYEDGLIYMENIKGSSFKEFNWIHSQKQLRKILLNNKEIISGEDLPERNKLRLQIK